MVKRAVDVVVAAALLVATSPLSLLAMLRIKREDGGPLLYRAPRVGQHGDVFAMNKFRTMVTDADKIGGSSTAGDDPRITRTGQFLRKWKLDELPQLWNVLVGEMSLVGPRPQVQWDVDRYTLDERRLLEVRPGITDWASIRFSNEGEILAGEADPDEAYDRLIRPEKIRLGLAYVDQASLRTDVAILASTVRSVVLGPPEAVGPSTEVAFDRVTETGSTRADDQQWELASQRYSLAAALGAGGRVLEVGCGTAYGLRKVAAFTDSAVGIDINQANVDRARSDGGGIEVGCHPADEIPFDEAEFDLVMALEMLYYLPDQDRFLREAARVLRSNGRLLVTMPNPGRPAFSPSPFSTSYPLPPNLVARMHRAGFGQVEVYGGLPLSPGSTGGARELLRRAVIASRLMPSSIEGRARLKRLAGARTRPLETIEVEPDRGLDGWTAVSADEADKFGIVAFVASR